MKSRIIISLIIVALITTFTGMAEYAFAQEEEGDMLEETLEREILSDEEGAEAPEDEGEEEAEAPLPEEEEEFEEERGEIREVFEEGEGDRAPPRRKIKIAGVIIANYVFENANDTFQIKYALDISGDLNAQNAVITGDAEIAASVDGALAKWPTGECKLKVEIPKVPYEIRYRETSEDKGNIRFRFKKAVDESWSSNCAWSDGAKFDTIGPPERWITRALKKAKPPLRSIVIDLKDEATSTTMVIPKQIIGDPPIGSMEIEGTLSVTVAPPSEGG